MKRTTLDVPRWYLYLHRRERGMPYADALDGRERRFEDELFARLFAPDDVGQVPEGDVAPDDREWCASAQARIEACVEDFAGLARSCRGSASRAAEAVEQVLAALAEDAEANGLLENGTPAGSPSASARQAAHGLSGVSGYGGGSSEWRGETEENRRALALADQIRDDDRLKRIALLAGRFKTVALSKQKSRTRTGADEIVDIEQGDDLRRLLPTEVGRLASPRRRLAALRDLLERRCLQYQMESVESLGRGPVILCVDKSGSMEGDKDVWSVAAALALLEAAHRDRRTFILVGFNDDVVEKPYGPVVILPGRAVPQRCLFAPCDGGTDISRVLDFALSAIESRTKTWTDRKGKIRSPVARRADVVLVTDGQSSPERAAWIKARAEAAGARIFGLGIGVPAKALSPWCGEVASFEDVSGDLGEQAASVLFGPVT